MFLSASVHIVLMVFAYSEEYSICKRLHTFTNWLVININMFVKSCKIYAEYAGFM